MSRLLDSIKSIPQLPSEQDPSTSLDDTMSSVRSFTKNQKERKSSHTDEYDMNYSDLMAEIDDNFDASDFIDADDIFDAFSDSDSDIELQNNLISLGRRYTHEGGSKETSDIAAQFIPQESALKKMISDLDGDIISVGKDISAMRVSRSRNFKAMSDLISAQSSLYSTKLSAIKEQNNIKKTIADLKMKIENKAGAGEDASLTASMAVQQLFGGSQGVTINTDDMSSSTDHSVINNKQEEIDDDAQLEQIFPDDKETEGDIYLKYENQNVSIHCVVNDDTGEKHLVAKNAEGTVIPDYPLPGHLEDLSFTVHEDLGTVSDNLGRSYILDHE